MTIKKYLQNKYGFENNAVIPKEFLKDELLDIRPPRVRSPLKFEKFCQIIEDCLA